VVYFEVIEIHAEFYSGRLSEDTPREGPSLYDRMTLKWILVETAYIGVDCILRVRNEGKGEGGSCVHDNEYLESVNVRISLDNSSDC